MKAYQILIFLLCLIFIHSIEELTEGGCTSNIPASKEKCINGLSDSEKKSGKICCYFRSKLEHETERCLLLNKYQFEHLADVIDFIKLEEKTGDLNIECGSTYFKLGLLSLIFLFL